MTSLPIKFLSNKPIYIGIEEGGKKPLQRHGLNHCVDRRRIEELRKVRPFNIAIKIGMESCVWVLDVDGPVGMANLKRLQIAYGKLPTTYTVQTPSGGMHYYFQFDPQVKRTISFIAKHIDTIVNGYCLIPPSIINGKQYKVIADASIVPAPDWLVRLASNTSKQIDTPAKNKTVVQHDNEDYEYKVWQARKYVGRMAPAFQGQAGHTQLLRVCIVLRKKFNLNISDCRTLLEEYNTRCVPPWRLDIPRERADFFRKLSEAEKCHG